MLYTRNDTKSFETEFKKRFTNFCDKSPVLLSFAMTPTSVQVIDEANDDVYEFPWEYSSEVKEFIHKIKHVLIEKCYPVILQTLTSEVPLTIEEQTRMAGEGTPIESIPLRKVVKTTREFLIDKVIVYKDVFIIEDRNTKDLFRYKLNRSSIFFLKKIRSGEFSREEAGEFFFKHGVLLNKIVPKEA